MNKKKILLAIIKDSNTAVGYIIYDENNSTINKITHKNMVETLEKEPNGIDGLEIAEGDIKGSNGSLNRYSALDTNGRLLNSKALVVLRRIGDLKLECLNVDGRAFILTTNEAIQYSKLHGIANGKIVNKNNQQIISSITGQYEYILEENQKDMVRAFADGANTYASMVKIKYKDLDFKIKLLNDTTEILISINNKELKANIMYNGAIKIENLNYIGFPNLNTGISKIDNQTDSISIRTENGIFQCGMDFMKDLLNKILIN